MAVSSSLHCLQCKAVGVLWVNSVRLCSVSSCLAQWPGSPSNLARTSIGSFGKTIHSRANMDIGYYVHNALVGAGVGLVFCIGFLSLVYTTERICYAIETYIKDN